eukprot:CAMPEP_0178409624 /NCGR_PEP_ID=MMETSP0689_2-20121128/20558_1 /TAXON_ID=160604 /ORGANISM="Amphidinium massartii, Strain CS-259" /LENGTH=264 /DNA_ID=CAMNT_0020030771 /DNA_START=432 /DNA_END=1226 /DNA_ORIENTATION=-
MEKRLEVCRASNAVDIPCHHPGCSEGISHLLNSIDDFPCRSEVLEHLKEKQAYMRRILFRSVRGPDAAAGPVCPICQEDCVALVANHCCGQEHAACETCWARWAEEQIDECILNRSFPNRCLWQCQGCKTQTSEDALFWQLLQASTVNCSPQLKKLFKDLTTRCRLQKNPMYPPEMQVNCPQPDCVGLGYLGLDTVMCFCCEHLWMPGESNDKQEIPGTMTIMGVEVKRCPECGNYIEKNGGCNHMKCVCGHEFSWISLKPWKM